VSRPQGAGNKLACTSTACYHSRANSTLEVLLQYYRIGCPVTAAQVHMLCVGLWGKTAGAHTRHKCSV